MKNNYMGQAKISIITICFNSEKTIERTIKSVLNQTRACDEYIIIDGASKDGTLDIVKRYEHKFRGRLKWISEPDKGIYDAMNKGIQTSSGDIIGIVNSDDWLESSAIKSVEEAYEHNECSLESVYCGWMNFHYKNGDIQVLKTDHYLLERKSTSYIMAGIRHPAVFVPKKVYEENGTFDTRMKISADTDFILRCLFNGVNFYYLDKTITNMSDGGVSNRTYIISQKDYKLILKKYNLPSVSEKILLIKNFLRLIIKSILPVKGLKLYRKII